MFVDARNNGNFLHGFRNCIFSKRASRKIRKAIQSCVFLDHLKSKIQTERGTKNALKELTNAYKLQHQSFKSNEGTFFLSWTNAMSLNVFQVKDEI